MPRGMGKLSCLQKLPLFVVGDNNSTTKQSIVEQMEELKALTNLKGSLEIKILKNTEYIVENAGERGYIRNQQHLSRVAIVFPGEAEEHNRMRDDEEVLLLEDLQPHPKLRELELEGYMGSRMPSWATEDNLAISLPNLVRVKFEGCHALQQLPSLRKFRDLKFLRLSFLNDLEHIENTTRRGNISDGAGTSELDAFFPSLETLCLTHMPKLKGWWRDEEISNSNGKHGHQLLPSFPHLIMLSIEHCPNLTCIPRCPTVKELWLEGEINENLVIMVTSESGNSELRRVTTENARGLKTILPVEGFQCLETMTIFFDDKVESLSEGGEVFRSCSSSLKSLQKEYCRKLKSLCPALEHLTVFERLEINDAPSLNLDDKEVGENDAGKPCLEIKILKNTEYIVENAGERGYIRNKQHLTRVAIGFPRPEEEHNRMRDDEEVLLLEDLQPHPKLRELQLSDYMGRRMPSWAREDNFAISLPNLVKVSLRRCYALQQPFRKFHDLKHLELSSLNDLEYIENTRRRGNISDGAGTSELDAFFHSLETLRLSFMPKLKGWWRDEISNSNGKHGHQLLPSFPHLIKLTIQNCPNLTCIPPCPTVEELRLAGEINENLVIMVTCESGNSKLRSVMTENARGLKTISPMEGFQCLERMTIFFDDKVESLSEVGEVFRSCSSSLKSLQIWDCPKLKSLCGALEHLTVLESIEIKRTPSLNLDDKEMGENDDGKPGQCLHQSLRFLTLEGLPELVSLPKGMQYLTALQSLSIIDCARLESLPESMPKLTSLKTLDILVCSAELNERCREPTGEDWPIMKGLT
ncbi:hypothetical protein Cgig2_010492 [Carnegiea gigantea]|uniref:Uncharacterized protein n=1 Tax=Carnegiea gigantea TaxID=171969 RepID=A0A9Q1QQH0_9CARY|nr:hypothetical protein Cgig2_010492 [Carnegiea gigantea]